MLVAFSIALCALAGPNPTHVYERHFYRSVAPMLEWVFAVGLLAVMHFLGMAGVIGLREWDAASVRGALGWRIAGYC